MGVVAFLNTFLKLSIKLSTVVAIESKDPIFSKLFELMYFTYRV